MPKRDLEVAEVLRRRDFPETKRLSPRSKSEADDDHRHGEQADRPAGMV
jgi:hypothetical protein